MTLVELERQGKLRVPCEVYSRIVGYLRPIQSWHVGKRQEYEDRRGHEFDARPNFDIERQDEIQEKSDNP
jgi:hypothetical protein